MPNPSPRKILLLLQPQRLLHRHPVVEILEVVRKGAMLDLEEIPISTISVQRYLKNLPSDARKILLKLSKNHLREVDFAVGEQFKMQTAKKRLSSFRDRAIAFHYHQNLGFLKQFTDDITWYHRLPSAENGKVRTAPCTYHPLAVSVEFELTLEDEQVFLHVSVVKGNERFALTDFRRFHFLLEKNDHYLHLTLKSYEALEWLQDNDYLQWPASDQKLTHAITQHLQEQQLQVNANAILKKDMLEVEPVKRVLLSELNNTFLMLTPQFVYDGHVMAAPFEPATELTVNGLPLLVIRHRETEEGLVNFLRDLHPNFSRQINGFFYLSFADAQKKAWFLKVYHQLLQMDIELLGMDMLRHFRYSPFMVETSMEMLQNEGDWLRLKLKVSFGKETVPLGELQKMLLNGQKAVLLKDGSLGVLGDDWLREFSQAIKHGKVQKTEILIPRWLALGVSAMEETPNSTGSGNTLAAIRFSITPDWWKRWQHWQSASEPLYALPPNLQIETLRPYQQKGYEWLRLLAEAGGSACLADDMGLGKTLQTICFLLHRLNENPNARHLVVCPASLMYNWQQELAKFAPGLSAHIHHGSNRNAEALGDAASQVVITSYGTMRQDIELLKSMTFDVVVLDESHHIKNPAALVTRAIGQISGQTRIALSGTPVMNGTGDLYSQLNFLLPGLLGSREFFAREYSQPIEENGDREKAAALQKLINPFVLRRTKQQAAPELPAKTESILWCEMGVDQREAYETVKDNVRSSVFLDIEQKGLNQGKMAIMAGLMKLRQLCNSSELVTDQDLFNYDSIKTKLLIEELRNIVPQHRALVFSQFTSMLDLLERDFKKAGLAYMRLDGQTKAADRQALVNQFQAADSESPIFLISLKAGNAGLNLTAADYVFLFDPWWNVAVENQAIDRTHRIGQPSQVFAYRLICKDTIEEKIIRMAERKKVIADDLVTADESFVKSLSMEDVAYLLQ